ncbi:recombinase family protein [Psychromonas algarum]|uniref:recombinase family protein n=1 Tax=Psychromonas algarum TaxID=2555643 RepID=UPI001ABAD404|nr:recombinase family protein [Psychromonas sp. RZ22]
MLLSYIRVSTVEQNDDRQLIEADKTFTDKVSGSTTDRAELNNLKDFARLGDTVTVHDISRLARNIKDLIDIIEFFNSKGVAVEFRKEAMTFTADKKNPMNQLMLNLLGSVYQFEREIMLERQKEGIAKAKAKGVYKGRKPTVDYALIEQHLNNGLSIRKTVAETGYSLGTVAKVSKKLKG